MQNSVPDPVAQEVIGFLSQRIPGGKIGMATPLLTEGSLDSLGIVELSMFLDERFGIAIEDQDFEAENFESVAHISAFVQRKRSR